MRAAAALVGQGGSKEDSVFFRVVFLAVLQGVAEFLPISSSGHLVIAKHFLGVDMGSGILLEVALHAGTLLSILIYYRVRIIALCLGVLRREKKAWQYGMCVVLGSLPAAVGYAVLGDWLEARFSEPIVAAGLLCLTGCVLLSLRLASGSSASLTWWRALVIGIAQAFAMLPGVSRSGSTIVTGRWLSLSAREAAEFSFLMSIPALGGALLLEIVKLFRGAPVDAVPVVTLFCGFVVSALVGLGALSVLIQLLAARRFWLFGWYCLGAGLLAGGLLLAGF